MSGPAPSSTSPSLEDCNCLAIRQAARHVSRFYDLALAATGLRATQFAILSRLRRTGGATINQLAAELALDRTTLGRNLRPLQRDGLISIEPGQVDRRSKALRVTPLGLERLAVADPRWSEAQRGFEKAFGRKRSAKLRNHLRAVLTDVGAPADPNDETDDA